MGIRNYLIEGVSGTGKTSVCKELRRRGYHAINGDNEPETLSADLLGIGSSVFGGRSCRVCGLRLAERGPEPVQVAR